MHRLNVDDEIKEEGDMTRDGWLQTAVSALSMLEARSAGRPEAPPRSRSRSLSRRAFPQNPWVEKQKRRSLMESFPAETPTKLTLSPGHRVGGSGWKTRSRGCRLTKSRICRPQSLRRRLIRAPLRESLM
jgi:hypothetical protein